ncbi:hypothetical protein R2406_002230 [Escherichia coli]
MPLSLCRLLAADIDLSETQENAEETIIQTESQPENESQDDNGKEVATEPEKTEETPEDYALRIGDEEIQLNADDDDHIDGQYTNNYNQQYNVNVGKSQRQQSQPAQVSQPAASSNFSSLWGD